MNQLLEASARFPTVVFSIGLGVALIYWLFVLLGALDIDLFGDAAGAGKGGVEGLKGLKPDGGDADGGGLWKGLGFAQVPITISFSVIMLLGWVGSLLAMVYLRPAIGSLGGWFPGLVLVAMLVVAVLLAGLAMRPLAPVFEMKDGKSNADYVGHTCTITTGSVDDGFGQANLEDGGTVLVIPVRCDKPGLGRGHKALIVEFDPERQAYVVEPAIEIGGSTS